MRHVAFLRNLNQGQRNNPTSAQLTDTFGKAGASDVSLVRGNGTALFSAEDPVAVAEAAARSLFDISGWKDVVFVRSVAQVAEFLSFVNDGAGDARQLELSLFDEAVTPALPLAGRRCAVVTAGPGFAIVVNERAAESNGTPTLERALRTRVTSRGLPTVQMIAT